MTTWFLASSLPRMRARMGFCDIRIPPQSAILPEDGSSALDLGSMSGTWRGTASPERVHETRARICSFILWASLSDAFFQVCGSPLRSARPLGAVRCRAALLHSPSFHDACETVGAELPFLHQTLHHTSSCVPLTGPVACGALRKTA